MVGISNRRRLGPTKASNHTLTRLKYNQKSVMDGFHVELEAQVIHQLGRNREIIPWGSEVS